MDELQIAVPRPGVNLSLVLVVLAVGIRYVWWKPHKSVIKGDTLTSRLMLLPSG